MKIRIPGSKSYTNRALIMAALTKGPVHLINPVYCDDTEAMIGCLRELGVEIETTPNQIVVHGDVGSIANQSYNLFAVDSGTTVRFMLALLCIVPGVKIIQGNPRLNERPIRDLVDGLRELGAAIEYCAKEGCLPLKVSSSKLTGSSVHLKADVSSQFCTSLLLISPYLPEGLSMQLVGPLISKSYVGMTVQCMEDWGISFAVKENGMFVIAPQCYRKQNYVIEGDFSSAGYFFAIAALTQTTIHVENMNPCSVQGDRKFLEALEKMGNVVTVENNGICVEGKRIIPLDIDMEDCPDQVITMAVLAAFADGVTKISGVRSLRVKETERVLALKNELGKMGIRTEDTHDTLTIYGGSPKAADIATYNDHRMAMAFAVAKMRLSELTICNPEVVSKTFPTFWEVLFSLR